MVVITTVAAAFCCTSARHALSEDPPPAQPPAKKDPTAVDLALDWLAKHQSPDGAWRAATFDEQCGDDPCGGTGSAECDVGVSSLALLCFLGAGETHQEGDHKDVVKQALKWLRNQQDAEGCVGPRTSRVFQHNHAHAALALAEAYGLTGSRLFERAAKDAIAFVERSRNPYLGWRYGVADGDNDTTVTGEMLNALFAAEMAELGPFPQARKDALVWVDKVTDPATGRVGYTKRGERPQRYGASATAFPPDQSEALTAVGLLVRVFARRDDPSAIPKDPMAAKAAELLAAKPPRWDPTAGSIDFYYWLHGTVAMHQWGGEPWKIWNGALKEAVVPKQHVAADDHRRGSWDPVDPWSGHGGRVYSTATLCLTLETYYRYRRLLDPKKK